MSKASDILYDIITYCTLGNFSKKPGAMIERLPERTRKELAKLTSEDVQNLRPPDYYNE